MQDLNVDFMRLMPVLMEGKNLPDGVKHVKRCGKTLERQVDICQPFYMETITSAKTVSIHEGDAVRAFIHAHPGMTLEQVAEAMGKSYSSLNRYLKAEIVDADVYKAMQRVSTIPVSILSISVAYLCNQG